MLRLPTSSKRAPPSHFPSPAAPRDSTCLRLGARGGMKVFDSEVSRPRSPLAALKVFEANRLVAGVEQCAMQIQRPQNESDSPFLDVFDELAAGLRYIRPALQC